MLSIKMWFDAEDVLKILEDIKSYGNDWACGAAYECREPYASENKKCKEAGVDYIGCLHCVLDQYIYRFEHGKTDGDFSLLEYFLKKDRPEEK